MKESKVNKFKKMCYYKLQHSCEFQKSIPNSVFHNVFHWLMISFVNLPVCNIASSVIGALSTFSHPEVTKR